MNNKYEHINLDYLEKHSIGKTEIIDEMLRLSILNVNLYHKEITEYYVGGNYVLMGESSYWAKEKFPLVGLNDLSLQLSNLEKLCHKKKDSEEMKAIVQHFDTIAPQIIKELEHAKSLLNRG